MAQVLSKNWCFTINNYGVDDILAIDDWECQYLIYGLEVGESGTPHVQGYIVFAKNKALTGVKKLHKSAHWEKANGSTDENVSYCSKEGTVTERGEKPISNKRKGEMEVERWDNAVLAAKEGRFDDIPSQIYLCHLNSCHKLAAMHQSVPAQVTGELINQWIYGPAGCGKTSRVILENPNLYYKGLNKWWDGYVTGQTVIVDDMDPYHKSLAQEFKMWGQHQPFAAEIKGGSCVLRPPKVVVTSNYSIDEVWEDETTRAAMHRRFIEIDMRPVEMFPIFRK